MAGECGRGHPLQVHYASADIDPTGKSSSSYGEAPALDCSEQVASKGAMKDSGEVSNFTSARDEEMQHHDGGNEEDFYDCDEPDTQVESCIPSVVSGVKNNSDLYLGRRQVTSDQGWLLDVFVEKRALSTLFVGDAIVRLARPATESIKDPAITTEPGYVHMLALAQGEAFWVHADVPGYLHGAEVHEVLGRVLMVARLASDKGAFIFDITPCSARL